MDLHPVGWILLSRAWKVSSHCFTNILRSSFHFLRHPLVPLTAFVCVCAGAAEVCVRALKASVFRSILWLASSQLPVSCIHQQRYCMVIWTLSRHYRHQCTDINFWTLQVYDCTVFHPFFASFSRLLILSSFSVTLPISVWCDLSFRWLTAC